MEMGDACNHVTVTTTTCLLQKGTAQLTEDSDAHVLFKVDSIGKQRPYFMGIDWII